MPEIDGVTITERPPFTSIIPASAGSVSIERTPKFAIIYGTVIRDMAFENSEYKLETVTSIRSWIYTGDQANARSLVRARLAEPRGRFLYDIEFL